MFMCTANSCRSILSEAMFNHLAPSGFEAVSAGSVPRGQVLPRTLITLREAGLSTEGLASKGNEAHPKVQELLQLMQWSEGQVWCSPERHGSMSAVFKAQIDWVPLAMGAVRPTQGKTLAVMQVCGGSQSFNVVNQLRVLGRWMRMFAIPNQSSVPKAYLEFDEQDRMKASPYYDRVVDVMEELMKFTILLRDRPDLVDRYSERKESAEQLSKRVNQRSI
nr:NAD(P)H-dependent oxidoreductase [Stutzerimonas stutzeri]